MPGILDAYARATALVAPLMLAIEGVEMTDCRELCGAAPGCGPCDALDAEMGRVDRTRGRALTADEVAQIEPADWEALPSLVGGVLR